MFSQYVQTSKHSDCGWARSCTGTLMGHLTPKMNVTSFRHKLVAKYLYIRQFKKKKKN